MIRKLIKQGKGGYTIYLPKQWVDSNHLNSGAEIEIRDEKNNLIITPKVMHKENKSTTINLEQLPKTIYRSIIGSLYRGGFDEIKVKYKDPEVLSKLQYAVNLLYGFEILEVDDKSCVIKNTYDVESTEALPFVNRMIHTIKTMQNTILIDIKNNDYNSREALDEYRKIILKQRDIVQRIIVRHKLLDNKIFPFYTITTYLWHITRNYDLLYDYLREKKIIPQHHISLFEKTNQYFSESFEGLHKHKLIETHLKFEELFSLATNDKEATLLVGYCLNIILSIQSCSSSIMLLNYS
ncbi:TPA: AbrB/MazE/SpoVT family DNA-binding domain-containing protein [Candidatus Woesearchaeota archaeon]|nr:AbrB/MazE/SpoVT family DNA-binding domain-containing protein [Candidatus Woesearchaeota archaeon]